MRGKKAFVWRALVVIGILILRVRGLVRLRRKRKLQARRGLRFGRAGSIDGKEKRDSCTDERVILVENDVPKSYRCAWRGAGGRENGTCGRGISRLDHQKADGTSGFVGTPIRTLLL